LVKNEKGSFGGLNSILHVVYLLVEEERSLTSRESKAAVLLKEELTEAARKKERPTGIGQQNP
jgi:hypothetical protein